MEVEPGGVEPPSKLAAEVLSTRLVAVWLSARGRYGTNQPRAYLLNFAHASKPALAIHPFVILLTGRRTAGLPGKHPVPQTLSGLRDSLQLSSESIVVAIYWLRELVFNGTVSQPPTCLQIHIHAVKTKRPHVVPAVDFIRHGESVFYFTSPVVFNTTRSVSAFDITVTHLLINPECLAV